MSDEASNAERPAAASSDSAGGDLPTAVLKPRQRISWAWLLPVAALILVGGLMHRAWSLRGVVVTVQLEEGHGLKPGDPVLSLGQPTFEDEFADESNIYTYDDAQASFSADDNKLVMVAKKANNYEAWTLSWGDLKNFYIEITGEFGSECGGRDRFGMIFRAPDTSEGYLVSVTCEGSARLTMYESDDDEYTVLKTYTTSEHINSGPGAVNRLGVRAKNSTLTVFINGNEVLEKNDSTFGKGRWGVLVAATNTPGFTAYLDKVAYWKLP